MSKKKEKYTPIVLCGSFLDIDDIRDAFDLTDDVSIEAVTEKLKDFFGKLDFNDYPDYMRHVVLIYSDNILYDDSDDLKGYYIGIPFYEIPEQFSIKRACLDVRTLFVNSGLIPNEVDPDFIRIFSKILKLT